TIAFIDCQGVIPIKKNGRCQIHHKLAFCAGIIGYRVAPTSLQKSHGFTSDLTLPLGVSCATNDNG
ncbi:MAG: hypothetical protein ACPHUP_06415, partial [Candidatus Puniceispirillaceae bacterium]